MVATSSLYLIQKDDYWAIRADGGIGWIADSQISEKQQPGQFTESEVAFVKQQIPNVQVWNAAEDIPPPPEKDMSVKASSPKTRRGKLRVPTRESSATSRPLGSDETLISDWLEHFPTGFLWVLLFMMLLGIGAAIAWNVQPFIEMTRIITRSVDGGSVEEFLNRIPLIGGLLLGIGGGIIVITGCVWYAISQLLELAPMLMTVSDKKTLRMINAIANSASVEIKPGDSADVAWLKRKYNDRPVASLRFFRTCRIAVYTMELVICWITHPPVEGTPLDFLFLLVTGQFAKINWGNVFLTLSVLFLVEILFRIALNTLKHIHADRQIAKAEKEAGNA